MSTFLILTMLQGPPVPPVVSFPRPMPGPVAVVVKERVRVVPLRPVRGVWARLFMPWRVTP